MHPQFDPQPLTVRSEPLPVQVSARAPGKVASVRALTLGVAGLDFTPAEGATSCLGTSFAAAGQTCVESIQFTPTAVGLRLGAVVLLDASGRVLGDARLHGVGLGGVAALFPANQMTIAGEAADATRADLFAASTPLFQSAAIALDGAGNLFVADRGRSRIRIICSGLPSVTLLAAACSTPGSEQTARLGEASGAEVTLNDPAALVIDGAGNLYIADAGNNTILRLDAQTGRGTTIAGGEAGFSGDGGPASTAHVRAPRGLALDADGNVYVADTGNNRIRRINIADGTLETIAGTGRAGDRNSGGPAIEAELQQPTGLALDPMGDLLIADTGNHRVLRLKAVRGALSPSSILVTIAGSGEDGSAGESAPVAIAVDAADNIFITDSNTGAIRKVNRATGKISTVIQLHAPSGLALDASGNLFIADAGTIRKLAGNVASLTFPQPVRQLERSLPTRVLLENVGNQPLTFNSIESTNPAILDPSGTTCSPANAALAVSDECTIGVVFSPGTAASQIGKIVVQGGPGSARGLVEIHVTGTATPANTTTTTVASNLNPSGLGQPVTLTATISTGAHTGSLTGSVTFLDGASPIANPIALNSPSTPATASFTTSVLGAGRHMISAAYSGDPAHPASSSTLASDGLPLPPLVQDVLEGTATRLTSNANPAAPGASVTFTATTAALTPNGVQPDGAITFFDGTTILGNVSLNAQATAVYTTSTLTLGTHPISSTYGGDPSKDIVGSSSLVLNQQILRATSVQLESSKNPSAFGTAITFTAEITAGGASAAPTGLVNFLDGGVLIASETLAATPPSAAFTTSTLASATHAITAVYAGDMQDSPSTSASLNQIVTAPVPSDFTVTLAPNLTLKSSDSATLTVAVSSVGGFADAIGFGCASLPPGTHCRFAPVAVTLPANGNAVAQLTVDTSGLAAAGSSADHHQSSERHASLAGFVVSFSLALGIVFRRFRKRHTGLWSILLEIMFSAAALLIAGCVGVIVLNAPPGQYVIQVIAKGEGTGITRSQNVTLTIKN